MLIYLLIIYKRSHVEFHIKVVINFPILTVITIPSNIHRDLLGKTHVRLCIGRLSITNFLSKTNTVTEEVPLMRILIVIFLALLHLCHSLMSKLPFLFYVYY